ncbi:glycosyltransferase [Microbacterium gallinarum]|uniref:Glycosyltransferase subfamily 4-like N-terminal domain-containing protein n=1 Tax=Microbacterium gallinarum TaxID=2762209 RepID=A0ABR8WZY2_9MICO|nr:glycosyltransferase [Microbacterium gallinarum]MBD8022241.1 hypothetical protein [Microbacterium gallinarum]
MRIAISAVQFSNDRPIGSKRPRALAQLLAERGHDVTVFTPWTEPHETAPVPPGVTVRTLPPYPSAAREQQSASLWRRALLFAFVAPTVPRATVLSSPRLSRLFGIGADRRESAFEELNKRRKLTVDRVRSLLDARRWASQAGDQLTASETTGFDAILSTYAPFGSLIFGRLLARRNQGSTWVSDIRDAMVVPSILWTGRVVMAFQERKAIREASTITVVSEGVKHSILEQRANRRFADAIVVLPNGFLDRDQRADRAAAEPAAAGPAPLRIGYTGQIYAEGRDATPLFRAIDAIRQGHPATRVEVHYAGNQGHLMTAFAATFGLEDLVVDHGMLSHAQAVELQDSMDLLLVLSWNRRNSQGIISGKFGEYLAAEKPILALVTGDLAGAELSSLVRTMNVGHAWEEASGDDAQKKLTEFLHGAVRAREAGEPLAYEPDEDERATFDYETITSRFERLLAPGRDGDRPDSSRR